MKTLQEIKDTYESRTIDGRDLQRLLIYVPFKHLPFCGMSAKDSVTEKEWEKDIKLFTRKNILKQLKEDVAFGFDKALNQRGISSALMYQVVGMWNWILEEGLEDWNNYAQYGLPLFKATAIKYGFENPIGDDCGNEDKYSQ